MRNDIVNHRGVNNDPKRSYNQYPKEFKEEAVALVTDQGYTV
jgi:hypothetical protein